MNSASAPASTGFDPARLIEEHQTGIWRYLRALGCDAASAEDLTQETFLAVLRKPFDDYNPAATATYLRRTAYNLYVTLQRRKGRVIAVEDLEQLDRSWSRWGGRDDGEALVDALKDCLRGLSERAQLALQMRFRDRASRVEIAEQLAISEHGAKNLMQRAKQKLKSCIEGKLSD